MEPLVHYHVNMSMLVFLFIKFRQPDSLESTSELQADTNRQIFSLQLVTILQSACPYAAFDNLQALKGTPCRQIPHTLAILLFYTLVKYLGHISTLN